MARLLKVLIGIAVLSTLWDALLTWQNLKLIGFGFEANPIVSGPVSLVLIKLFILGLVYAMYRLYYQLPFDTRFVTITGLLALSAGQFYGGYSHIPILLENRLAEAIEVGDGNYTIYRPDGTTTTYTTIPDGPKHKQYFGTLFFIMTFPTIFSILNFYLTKWTSQDIRMVKK